MATSQPLSSLVQSLPPSSPITAPASPASPAASAPPTTAIYKNSTPLATLYTHIHTPLLLSTFLYRFPSLVASPVSALAYSAIPLALLQSIYCATCLQPANAHISSKKPPKKKKKVGAPASPQKAAKDVDYTGLVLALGPRLLSSLALTLLSTLPVLLTILLLGAPLTTHLAHTSLLSLHLALLALLPLFYARPLTSRHWLEILSGTAPLDEVYGAAMGAMAGAWLGAVPIPLDWDREWQAWPVTVVVGAFGGWGLGTEVGKVVAGRWRGSWDGRKG